MKPWLGALLVVVACGPQPVPTGPASHESQLPLPTLDSRGVRPAPIAASALWPARHVRGYDPRQAIRLVSIPEHEWSGDDFGSDHFRDVMTHASPEARFKQTGLGISTVGHETHHFLLAEIANIVATGERFFYFERGIGAYVDEPKNTVTFSHVDDAGRRIHKRTSYTSLAIVRGYLPDKVRTLAAGRYKTYLANDRRTHTGVLYLFDEWNAYLAGGQISIEAYRAGRYDEASGNSDVAGRVTRVDAVDGMIDFLYFASAGVLALAEREPDYIAKEQVRAVYAVMAEHTVHLFEVGIKIDRFRGFHGAELLEHFKASPDNKRIRDELRRWLGAEWTRRVLGF